jgi:predicted permease
MTSGRRIAGLPAQIQIQVAPDGQVLLFTLAVGVLTGILFGLAPAWNAFSAAPASALGEIRSGETPERRLFGKALVVAQVALSVVLLAAAGWFVGNLSNLRNLDLGFRRDHILVVSMDRAHNGYTGEQWSRACQELLDRLQSIPGVKSAALSAPTPLSGAGASRLATVEGFVERPEDRRYLSLSWVTPKYFDTLGTRMLAGRDFTFKDQNRSRAAVVNQALARYYFGGANAVGKHLTLDGDDHAYEIIGVVTDAKYYEIREAPLRTVFLDAFQFPGPASDFVLRTSIDPLAIAPEVRRVMRETVKTVPVAKITTLADQVDASIVPERLVAALCGLFGALGLLLAAIGIYGLLAYTVARRIHEIGIRIALGATRRAVIRMVLVEALAMVSAGLAAGIPLAYWGKRLAASLIEGLPVGNTGPVAFGAASIVAVALMAAYLPARRAAGVDAMETLRHE